MDELNIVARGPAGAIPIVFLHGFGGSSASWDKVIGLFGDGMRSLAVDLPGHAGSLGAEGRGGAGRMAKAVEAALATRGLSRFHLCGHSLGGAVAALLAMRAPGRVASLTLVAPGGFAPDINAELLARYAAASSVEDIGACLAEMAAPGFTWPDAVIAAMAGQRREEGALEALSDIYRAMFPNGPAQGQGVLPHEQLAKLEMPAAVLWGSADRVVPFPGTGGIPANFALSLLAGFGHMLPEEAPDAIVRVLAHMAAD